ncbi:hypothetical protein XENOCAPTIV_028506, partial [Xenoophorus captivus]
ELSQQSSKHKEDVASLQKSISALDREKDALQDEVDQKTEKLVALQNDQTQKDVQVTTQEPPNMLTPRICRNTSVGFKSPQPSQYQLRPGNMRTTCSEVGKDRNKDMTCDK